MSRHVLAFVACAGRGEVSRAAVQAAAGRICAEDLPHATGQCEEGDHASAGRLHPRSSHDCPPASPRLPHVPQLRRPHQPRCSAILTVAFSSADRWSCSHMTACCHIPPPYRVLPVNKGMYGLACCQRKAFCSCHMGGYKPGLAPAFCAAATVLAAVHPACTAIWVVFKNVRARLHLCDLCSGPSGQVSSVHAYCFSCMRLLQAQCCLPIGQTS